MEWFKQVTKNNEYVWMKVTNSLEMLLVSMWQLLLLLLYLTPFNHWLVFLLATFLISYAYSLLFSFSWSPSVFCNSFSLLSIVSISLHSILFCLSSTSLSYLPLTISTSLSLSVSLNLFLSSFYCLCLS